MQGVGPGTVLGGRYAVSLRTTEGTHHERWRATDQTLEREVVVVCFPAGSPVAPAALDAARRAAGIEDPRLVRVLDVGTDQGIGYVVEEPLTGALQLSHLLQMGGLSADEVRRITGEAATALDRAGHRGLHHLVLTPASVLRMPDGDVKVRGLATEAALTEADRLSDERASRADAVGLVKIAYAGLTGRWPMVGVDGGLIAAGSYVGLEPAPTVVGGVAAPSEIAVGVPNDLDLICRMTLGGGHRGPVSPGDLALQIAPWPTEAPASDGASGIGLSSPREDHSTRVMPPVPDVGVAGTAGAVGGAGGAWGAGAPDRTEEMPRTVAAAGAAGSTSGAPAARAASTGDAWSDPWADDTDSAYGPGTEVLEPVGHGHASAGDGQAEPSGSASARASAGLAAAGAAAAGVAGSLGDKVGSFARAAADKAAARAAERRHSAADDDEEHFHLSDALDEATTGRLEPVVPVFGRDAPDRPSGAQSRIALAVVGVLVLVGLVIGVQNVAKIGQHDGPSGAQPAASSTKGTPSAGTSSAQGTTTPQQTSTQAPPATPVSIVSGKGYDEQDGSESDRNAKRAFDGDPSTTWRSRWYGTPTYNGDKEGLGLILELSRPTAVQEVVLELPAAQDVTVYATDGDSRQGAQEVGSASDAQGTVTIKASGELQPASKIIVFVTKAAPDEEPKHFRAQISEVTVR